MLQIRDRPIFTEIYGDVRRFVPETSSVYFYGTFEERSEHSQDWRDAAGDVIFVELAENGPATIDTKIAGFPNIPLRDIDALKRLLSSFRRNLIYIDLTGLSHHVWAPLLRAAWESRLEVRGVYVEPADYRFSPIPTKGQIFDLSERIDGIAPIPGFASLADVPDEQVCFVPLLGFEGTRFAYLVEQVEPPGGRIFPVVGVPGFRAEYPFHTYLGNQSSLAESRAWKNVRYARANCPFSLFYVLEDIKSEHPQDHLKIAPIGTKPHALGAVMYCLVSPKPVELVYDHPKRSLKRTSGAARCLLYAISDFLPTPSTP